MGQTQKNGWAKNWWINEIGGLNNKLGGPVPGRPTRSVATVAVMQELKYLQPCKNSNILMLTLNASERQYRLMSIFIFIYVSFHLHVVQNDLYDSNNFRKSVYRSMLSINVTVLILRTANSSLSLAWLYT